MVNCRKEQGDPIFIPCERYSALFDNDRTEVDDKQRPCLQSTSTTEDSVCVCRAGVYQNEEKH
jgi:hypothetical protein